MRKILRRRLFYASFILSILFMSSLIFITVFQDRQKNIIDSSDDQQLACITTANASSLPPSYLVIPYREFVLRTSIACREFKFDSLKKDAANFHPKYSKYLRGAFPYVVPATTITFQDVEHFYTKVLVHKKTGNATIETAFAKNITFDNIPYRFHEGMWHPVGVTSAQRTAVLVPLQGRQFNAKAFLFNIHAFLRRQQLTYTILLIEQASPGNSRFNKGRLYNTAVRYLEKQALNITCLILHDVDLIPENDGNFYTCESKNPKHTTSRIRQLGSTRGYTRYYEFLIGGVLLLTLDMYKTVNGFSNLYWGWGGEDDDLALRFIQRRMCVVRPAYELAIYVGLPHPRGRRNDARYSLLAWATVRLNSDGYAQIKPLTRIMHIHQTSTVTHLKLDVDANANVNSESAVKGKAASSSSSSSSPNTSNSRQ